MDVKDAITTAKRTVAEMFADEHIVNIGLEEVRLDEDDRDWLITVGFSRVPKMAVGQSFAGIAGYSPNLPRIYKVVKLSKADGSFVSITNRAVEG